ncbi:hypothetical protein [Aquisalimonas sp.]|uniref:hypothetical protein n=1 Tax=unclassified Aquisalimonas TaxID=2644645 RepID=UPI0025C23598|nr:hypothetical protein [Aquisalimonas sp.]
MTHFVCTVEYRDPESGAMHHFVRELNAPDGDAASDAVTRSFLDEHASHGSELEIAEIVCRPDGGH